MTHKKSGDQVSTVLNAEAQIRKTRPWLQLQVSRQRHQHGLQSVSQNRYKLRVLSISFLQSFTVFVFVSVLFGVV